jgi:hypothetical protein
MEWRNENERHIIKPHAVISKSSWTILVRLHQIKIDTIQEKLAYLKVDIAILVHIECSKDMVAKFLRIPTGKKHFVHVYKFCWCKSTVGTVLL